MNWKILFFGPDGEIGAKVYYGATSNACALMNSPPEGAIRACLMVEADLCCGNKEWRVMYERTF